MSRHDFYALHNRDYHSARQLLARGWSLALIADILGEPDVIQETSLGDRKLYLRGRVVLAERESLEVVQVLSEYWQTKVSDATRKAKLLATRFDRISSRKRHQKTAYSNQDYD